MFSIPAESETCWVVWLKEETCFTDLPAVQQEVAIYLRAGPLPGVHVPWHLQALSCMSMTQGKCHIPFITHARETPRSLFPEDSAQSSCVGGPRACCLTIEAGICAFQDFFNLTPTTISPMLCTFCPAGNQDTGQSQHWQSWKYDVSKIAFVFQKVGPRLWAWGYTVSSHAEPFVFSTINRPTKNLEVSQSQLWMSTHPSWKLCRQPLEVKRKSGRNKELQVCIIVHC